MRARTALLGGLLPFLFASDCRSSPSPPDASAADAPGRPLVKVGQQTLDAPAAAAPLVDRPYFDDGATLRWDASPIGAASPCPRGLPPVERKTLMVAPRVDRVRCAAEGGAKALSLLVGILPGGEEAWRRRLGFASGAFTIDEQVLGASPSGIVLSDLAVIGPRNGETIVAPPAHPVGQEKRPVPDHDLTGAALYLPERRTFLWFSADVTLLERKGGLHAIDAAGRKELVLPVSSTFSGGYWRVEAMALAADGRHVLLAERFAFRGPGGVALAVLDLDRRAIVYQDRFGEDHFCADPQVVLGPKDSLGFAYLDATAAKRVLVHYRLAP